MIGFIGLSHLGLNYSLATAALGTEVVCYDPDVLLTTRLQRGDFPITEPGFKEIFGLHGHRISYTSQLDAIGSCDVVFYALDVRTNDYNESDLRPLTALIDSTAQALPKNAVAIIMSQVFPGYMRALVSRIDSPVAQWYYQVETLIFGDAVRRAMEPERLIVGSATPDDPLPNSYRSWLEAFRCPILLMKYESAELAKIAINFFLVSSVSTTNTLAELCEAIGATWSEIVPALRSDKRIGPHSYLKPGLGIAGGNLERDLVTVQRLSAQFSTEAGIVAAWQKNSAHSRFWALRMLERELLEKIPDAKIAVWGLAYKQNTHSIKNSPAIELIRTVTSCKVSAYDPVAELDSGLFSNLTLHSGALAALDGAKALIIMTPWPEFYGSALDQIALHMSGNLILDPYGVLDHAKALVAGFRHLQIGNG